MIFYIFYVVLLAIALFCATKITIADFRRRIIPDAYLFPLMLVGLILIAFFPFPISLGDAVLGATFGYITTCIIGIIFERRMQRTGTQITPPIGMGDIKLIGVGGLWLGGTGLATALVVACIGGALWAHRRHQKYIPFAPFFLIGGILSFIGNWILL